MQNEHLERVMETQPKNIRDLALLSVASRQGHPKMLEWYSSSSWSSSSYYSLCRVAPKKIQLPEFKLYVTHIKDYYYIGQWQCIESSAESSAMVKPLVQLLTDKKRREDTCKQCLIQVCRVLCHLKEKNISYVHGDLTVDNIVTFNRKYYIMDKGFSKQKSAKDPFFCYRLPTHDLYTLCLSMRNYFDTDSYFDVLLSGLPDDNKFLPEIFQHNLINIDSAISMYLKGQYII